MAEERVQRRLAAILAADVVGYPTVLDDGQAKREMKNWDQVNPGGIGSALRQSGQDMDCFFVGNNAGQGLPIASVLDDTRRTTGFTSAVPFAMG